MSELHFDSTSQILFKRANYRASMSSIILAKGEPCVDFQNKRLYIGDGSTPGGFCINLDLSGASFELADTSGLGPNISISCDILSAVLICDSTNDAHFRRLDFYDLHPLKRRHNMGDHGGSPYSIWYSNDTISYAIDEGDSTTTDLDYPVYDETTGYDTSSTTNRYKVIPLSYDIADLDTTTVPGTKYFLGVQFDTTNNQLLFTDTTALTHGITQHTGTADRFIYVNHSGNVALGTLGSSRTFFMSQGTTSAPTFTNLRYSDITGYSQYDTSNNQDYGKFLVIDTNRNWRTNQLLRYRYGVPTSILGAGHSMLEGSYGGQTAMRLIGYPESYLSDTYCGAKFELTPYDNDVLAAYSTGVSSYRGNAIYDAQGLQTAILYLKTASFGVSLGVYESTNLDASYGGTATDGRIVLSGTDSTTAKSFAIFNKNPLGQTDWGSTATTDPDFLFSKQGYLKVNSATKTETALNATSTFEGINIGNVQLDTTADTYVFGINVNTVTKKFLNGYTPASAAGKVAAFYSYNIDMTSQTINSTIHTIMASGVDIRNINSYGNAQFFHGGTITARGYANGIYLGSITADSTTNGIYISSVVSDNSPAHAILVEDVTGYASAIGLSIRDVRSVTDNAACIRLGIPVSDLDTKSTYGIYISHSIDGYLYYEEGTPSDGTGVGYAIYSQGPAPSHFGGAVDISGSLTLKSGLFATGGGGVVYINTDTSSDAYIAGTTLNIRSKSIASNILIFDSSLSAYNINSIQYLDGDPVIGTELKFVGARVTGSNNTISQGTGYSQGTIKLGSTAWSDLTENVITLMYVEYTDTSTASVPIWNELYRNA